MKTPVLTFFLCLLLFALGSAEEQRIVIGGLDGIDPQGSQGEHTVLLALSGGGIRGLASVGVLRAFEERGIRIAGIAGTSMGGIVGGLYAAGYTPAELEGIARNLDFAALFNNAPPRSTMLQTRRRERGRDLLTVRFDGFRPQIPQALTSAQYLTNVLTDLTTRATYQSVGDFSNLRLPFAAVSTDVVTGQRKVLDEGSLADAMRATMAFPLAFTGLEIDGMLLMDGGMVDPIPVEVARELSDSTNFVVAVNTASPLGTIEELVTPIDIADQVTTIMTAERLERSLRQADYVVTPVPNCFHSTDYRYCDSLMVLGYQAGLAAADSIRLLLERRVESNYVVIRDVVVDSLLEHHQPALTEALEYRSFDRSEFRRQLQQLVIELELFRLEAILIPGDSTMLSGAPQTLHLRGYEYFQPGAITFEPVGNTMFSDTVILRTLALSDSVITPERLKSGLERISNLYRTWQWDLACIREIIVDPESRTITIVIDEAVIRSVEVEGAERTRPWYVRAHFPLTTGEPYSTRRAAAGLKNIYGTDLFDRVTVDLMPNEGRPIVNIRVREKAYRQVRLGWHWDDEYESEEFVELVDDNIAGIGVEGLVHARYSPDRQDYHASLKADRIFKTYLTSTIKGYHTLLDRHLYNNDDSLVGRRLESKVGFEARLGQQIARLGTVSGALVVEQIEYGDGLDGAPIEELGLRMLVLESLVETFDRIPFPRSGEKHYFELQQAGKLVGGEVEFTRFYTSLEAYFSFTDYLTYHPKVALGLSRPELPWSEKFYLGGMHSLAGYRTHQLAGDQMLVFSQEVRLTLPLRLYLATRYDIGGVYASIDEIKPGSLRHGAAISLALDTPVGPMEIGYGVAEDDHDRLYLRAGFEF